jgi:hypothetical protein
MTRPSHSPCFNGKNTSTVREAPNHTISAHTRSFFRPSKPPTSSLTEQHNETEYTEKNIHNNKNEHT